MLGKKIGMTQVFDENDVAIPVTVIQAGPLSVVQKKTNETDGYTSVKVGYFDQPERKLNKPEKGLFEKVNVPAKKYLREFRVEDVDAFEIGQEIKVEEMFQEGDKIDISGISKGKGFQGVIKRYGYGRGPESHGSKYHRRVGSLGAGSTPAKVFKGRKMPGHMGAEKVTVQNLTIVRVDGERNLLLVKGAVPGPRGGFVVIKETVKTRK